MFDLFVWTFEHELLLFTVMLVMFTVMFYYEFFEKAAKFLWHEVLPWFFPTYKQTSIILVAGMCERYRFRTWACLTLTASNFLLTILNAILLEVYHPANLILGLIFFYSAAASCKVLGRYEQDLWDSRCNKNPEVLYENRIHISQIQRKRNS